MSECNVIKLRSSNLKALINKRMDAIDAMRHARMLQDKSWESAEMHHCRRLNYWIRIAVTRAFTDDHNKVHNRITELGKLI